jgi:caffeoyl-CoA O-methyltransferase
VSNRTLALTDNLYDYLLAANPNESALLKELRETTAADPMARMQIAPEQGHFLHFLTKLIGARRVIEVGTFTGYSAISIASALPVDGQLVCCDVSESWTAIARQFWTRAGLADIIELVIDPADKTLASLLSQGQRNKFDMAFIDADKENYDIYYEHCLSLVRTGGLIIFDNVLWGGKVADVKSRDADTLALRKLNTKLRQDKRIDMCMLPVADGLTLARKI